MPDNRETIERQPSIAQPSYLDTDWSTVDLSPGARVARGMLYVQRAYPDAWSIVDTEVLNINDGQCCVLGQLHGSYDAAPEIDATGYAWRIAHGFLPELLGDWDDELGECALNPLWRTAFASWVGSL